MQNIDFKSIGRRISNCRKVRNISQEELASIIQVSRTYMGYIETGRRTLQLNTLVAISNALEVPTDYLLEDCLENTTIGESNDILKLFEGCSRQVSDILSVSLRNLKDTLNSYRIS